MKFFLKFNQATLSRNLTIMTIALIIDMIWGDPKKIYNKIPHPIYGIGKLIHELDKKLNKQNYSIKTKKRNGFIAIFIIITLTGIVTHFLQRLIFTLFPNKIGIILSSIIASIFIAQRSLYEHVQAVKKQVDRQDIIKARFAVSQIVGRKTENLNFSEICCASIESLAENFSDGVISPIFWGIIGGLPGIIIFKSINTADSMIGHLTYKYRSFGYASAKIDDFANYIPARLSALLISIINDKNLLSNVKLIYNDARKHNSPNAGWPEAAMAYALNIQFACSRHYLEQNIIITRIGRGRNQLFSCDIRQSCLFFYKTSLSIVLILLFFARLTKNIRIY